MFWLSAFSVCVLAPNADERLCLGLSSVPPGAVDPGKGQKMNFWEALRIALRGLRTRRPRSALTMLGIIVRSAAVTLLVAIGNGVRAAINGYLQPLANLI